MKKVVLAAAALFASFAIAELALAVTTGGEGSGLHHAVIYQISSLNGSGEKGTVQLAAVAGNKTEVTITLTGEPALASQPAHIHTGACPTPGGVKWPLSNVIHGSSTTVVDAPLGVINKAGFAVNVHLSAKNIPHYVACGNLGA